MTDLLTPAAILARTKSEGLAEARSRGSKWGSDTVRVQQQMLTDAALEDLLQASQADTEYEFEKFARVVSAIIAARAGDIGKIPSFAAAPELIAAYLKAEIIDGWLYRVGTDGHAHPWLVTKIAIVEANSPQGEDYVGISLTADFPFGDGRRNSERAGQLGETIHLAKGDVSRKSPDDVLLKAGWMRETPELKAAYLERLAHFESIILTGFAEQYRYTGKPESSNYREQNPRDNRKVVHDVKPSELLPLRGTAASTLAPKKLLPVPVKTMLRVFDLATHEALTVNTTDLIDYEYDLSLRDKLILPDDQRELLDVLTTDLEAFTADIIEGKSAGNVVLAKGKPGVGKTLTAEVYAELVKRPLYSIHSGVLGVTAPDIRKNLEAAFEQAERWNAVMLLDEADVFVLERGNDIVQNAICAEFLRTLEYFTGLLFMTTNRADDIDDAIISRCAAIIDYRNPVESDAKKIWMVLATQMGAADQFTDALLDELLAGLPDISPRDMKMLLRLTLRMAASRNSKLTIDLFARCAMFRGLHFKAAA